MSGDLLSGVLVGKGTGNPLSTEVFSVGVGGELEDGSLGIGSAGNDLIVKKSVRKGSVFQGPYS